MLTSLSSLTLLLFVIGPDDILLSYHTSTVGPTALGPELQTRINGDRAGSCTRWYKPVLCPTGPCVRQWTRHQPAYKISEPCTSITNLQRGRQGRMESPFRGSQAGRGMVTGESGVQRHSMASADMMACALICIPLDSCPSACTRPAPRPPPPTGSARRCAARARTRC